MEGKGWSVRVLSTAERSNRLMDGKVSVRQIKAKQNPRSFLAYSVIWFKLAIATLKAPKADIVITLTDPPFVILIGSAIARLKKAKHIHWSHDVYPDLLPIVGSKIPAFMARALHKATRKRMNKANKVIAIGRCMSKRLAMTGVDQTNITVIPNWADPQIFNPSGKELSLLEPKAQMPENMFRDDSPKFRILYAGNIGKAHEVDMFLGAAKTLQDHREIEFVFVGTSDGHEDLAQERAKLGLDNIKFMPYQPAQNLRSILETGDIHLVSMKENTAGLLVPCKFYAALSVGRPILFLGPQKSEIGKVIETHEAGKIIHQRQAQILVDAILEYRNDGQAWFKAQEGAIAAGKVYNPESSLALWHDVLEEVIKT